MFKRSAFVVSLAIHLIWANGALAEVAPEMSASEPTWLDEFDPRDPRAEELLKEFDKIQEEETGQPSWLPDSPLGNFFNMFMPFSGTCYQESCRVFARVSKRNQRLYLSVNGAVQNVWAVSTGRSGHETPNFDRHPNGRIYDSYSSNRYPGGNWHGLGNMPYAVFISGGFAIHGTPEGNWPKLGQRDSHGCIRLHPDNAKIFNRLVRANGVTQTWITVEE